MKHAYKQGLGIDLVKVPKPTIQRLKHKQHLDIKALQVHNTTGFIPHLATIKMKNSNTTDQQVQGMDLSVIT